nr:hypothetical protein [uncultured Lichenicoccus sp.]
MLAILTRAMLLKAVTDIVRIDPDGLPGIGQRSIALWPQHRPDKGDLATNAPSVMANLMGWPDQPWAEALAARLADLPVIAAARAERGFVNIWLSEEAWERLLPRLLVTQPHDAPPMRPLFVPLADMSLDDPWFRIQYTHARCRSVQRAAEAEPALWRSLSRRVRHNEPIGPFPAGLRRALLLQLEHGARLAEEPDTSVVSVRRHLETLADAFERVWNDSDDHATVGQATLRFLDRAHADRSLVDLALTMATADAIRRGLGRHGVAAAEEIR